VIRRNALIFHSGGLGDFVLTWPLGLALGRLHPQSHIIYVTQGSKGQLAHQALRLDWRDAESSWPALHCDAADLDETCRRTLAGSHSIYTFVASADDAFCRNVAQEAPEAKLVLLRLAPPADFKGHVTEYLLQQLSVVPAAQTAVAQIIASIQNAGLANRGAEGGKAAGAQGPILISPGSGARDKCWPGFLSLVDRLSSRQVKVVLGEVELERFPATLIRQFESAAIVVKPSNYVDLFIEISNSAAFIGNDSGPSHLAGMMGQPTLVLFGPTDPAVWKPLGPHVAALRRSNWADLAVDDVCQALERLIGRGLVS
jgi:heptosyltransferase III